MCSIITQKNHENNKLLICLLPGHSWLPNLVEIQTARQIKWHVISWKSLGGCESVVLGSSFESDRHQKTATQKAADGIWTSDYTEGEDEPRWPPRMTSAFFSFIFFVLALFFCGRSWISTFEKNHANKHNCLGDTKLQNATVWNCRTFGVCIQRALCVNSVCLCSCCRHQQIR